MAKRKSVESSGLELFTGVVPFFHVAEQLGFRRAAEVLGVSTAAVSKAITNLELRLGTKLFVRNSRAVALTPEGKLFHARAREAVASMQAGRAQLAGARTEARGEVRVSASFILAPVVVGGLPALVARYPGLIVHLALTDRITGLLAEEIDVALRVGARTPSTLISRVLHQPRWVTVASPGFIARHGAPTHPSELARLDCARFAGPRGRVAPWWFAAPGQGPTPLDVDGRLVVDQGELLLATALAGGALAQVFDFMVAEPLRDGRLVEVLAGFATMGPPIHAVSTPERSRSANVRAVIELAANAFARLRGTIDSPRA